MCPLRQDSVTNITEAVVDSEWVERRQLCTSLIGHEGKPCAFCRWRYGRGRTLIRLALHSFTVVGQA